MTTTRAQNANVDIDAVRLLRRLSEIERPPGSPGEREASELLAADFSRRGAATRIESARVHGTYWVPIGLASAAAALAGVVSRGAAAAIGAAAAASVADDLQIGLRPLRRTLKQRTAHNVVAEVRPTHKDRLTLVVHAHHDAARTGIVFHPIGPKLMTRLAGGLVERLGATPAPMWGAVLGPSAVAAGALIGLRRLRLAGAMLSGGYAAAMTNIAFSRAVPGANDNLSSVCALLVLCSALSCRPPERVRVVLLSTGSEESFLEAMVRFGERHFHHLARERTIFLCLESIGSPQLMLLKGEGLLLLRRYPRRLTDTFTELASQQGVRLRDPFRYRMATDGQVPLLAGYPTAVISSMDWYKAPSNYHWPTDRPENLDLQRVADAATLAEAFVRRLDRDPGGAS